MEHLAYHGTAQRRRAQKGGLLAGKALCAERMVRAEYVGPVGQVGPVGLVRRLALGCVSAVCMGIFRVHGLPRHSAAKTGTEGGLLAGKALCAERMVRAEYVGPVGLVRRWTLGCVSAVCMGICKTHGLPRRSAAKTGAEGGPLAGKAPRFYLLSRKKRMN